MPFHHSKRRTTDRWGCWLGLFWFALCWLAGPALAEGQLTLRVEDEASQTPTIARLELTRLLPVPEGRRRSRRPASLSITPPRTIPAGQGFVVDEKVELSLKDGPYEFKLTRGLESRVLRGNFAIERSSVDEHFLALPRMISMRDQGWTSGDCLVPRSPDSLPMRMTAEDLHLARVIRDDQPMDAGVPERGREKPIAGRDSAKLFGDDEPITTPEDWPTDPLMIDSNATCAGGLAFFGDPLPGIESDNGLPTLASLASLSADDHVRVAIENPFAWWMPIWLASDKIDGVFVLGDWLGPNESRRATTPGRMITAKNGNDRVELGRDAQTIHWNLLDAGFRLAPLAGSGDAATNMPVGSNRLYVTGGGVDSNDASSLDSTDAWWDAAWAGHSVATNGPLLQARLSGQPPGHVFQIRGVEVEDGNAVELTPEVTLTVRDPVEYLEVIHNGRLHYQTKLDEFAKAGGKIPALKIRESGWALVRVVTLNEDTFQAAISSPWYFEIDGRPRVTERSVEFFQTWLSETEQRLAKLPAKEVQAIAPFVQSARRFWAARTEQP